MSYYKKRRKRDMVAAGLVITAVLAVGVGVGIAIGWSAAKKSVDVDESLNRDEDVTISEKMFQMIDVDNIRELLRCVCACVCTRQQFDNLRLWRHSEAVSCLLSSCVKSFAHTSCDSVVVTERRRCT